MTTTTTTGPIPAELPDALVVSSSEAEWLNPEVNGNYTRIGVLRRVPARTMRFLLQEIPAHDASDLQRHAHESVHYVVRGTGYSEIGERTEQWGAGDFVYTPPSVWHRHYNSGDEPVEMLLVENSALLAHLHLNYRDSAGDISFGDFQRLTDSASPNGHV